MKKIKTQTEKRCGRSCGMLCIAALAAFALFAACERPEPEPESPTPLVVGPEPPATCDLADATTDTLVFVDDTTLIQHHGTHTEEYYYEFSEHFIVSYWPKPWNVSGHMNSNRYYFRENDQELVLRGYFQLMGRHKNFCLCRISEN